jgi:hypothetical protein
MTKLDTGNPEIHGALELIRRSFNSGGFQEVQISDQTSPSVIIKANELIVATTVAVEGVRGEYTLTVADATGITPADVQAPGDLLIVTSDIGSRFYQGRVLDIVGNVLTLDTPLDYAYEVGQSARATETNMSVDGSSTPRVFSLRAAEPPGEGIDLTVDVTRIIIQCKTTSATSLANFGNIPKLTRGLVLRRVDGEYQNVFNVKDGHEIQGIAYDYDPTTQAGQGQDGFSSRLTFGGQNKIGVVKRIGPGEDLEVIVQDDLTLLTTLEVTFEGHIVQD